MWLTGAEVGSSLRSTTWTGTIERLKSRQVAILDGVCPRIGPQALHEIQAPTVGRWWVEVKDKDGVLLRTFQDVEVSPPRHWPLGRAPLSSLAAFVQHADPVVAELVGEAAGAIAEADARPAALRALEALQNLLKTLGLTASDRGSDAQVAGPRPVLASARASWLELQLLLAACLEHGGFPPLLIWASSGPALGLWTGTDRPALTETDDPVMLARLAEAGSLFVAAVGDHVLRLADETPETLRALDLAAARRAGVLPLPGMVLDDGRPSKSGVEHADVARERLLDRAALAGTRTGMLLPGAWSTKLARADVTSDAAPPRLQGWKRRLLDLTLNNPLLNLRPRVTSVPLLADDLAALEDSLASGQTFSLLARPSAPSPGQPRPDVTPEMMRASKAAGTLLVDLPEKRVAIQAKNAVRAYKAALDEGGVHTLFLSLGTLEWFDAATPEVPRHAPLLLVPVLLRRSKRGYFETKKADAETELNAALLELLHREHGIEVPGVSPLPGDATGVDVKAVFDAVRKALSGAPTAARWTVREEAQISVLAFSGFRMWRDLDHQAADLMRHPLVRRLAVGGDSGEPFAPPDAQWHPKDVLCPLDADASQLSAVLSAANEKSFVLEGPPGTGKSQTIANLIAQCLSGGKSVLFVAQKRAALEVVQSRLDAIGLGPFILELHSKKASKPEFIQQLRAAADFRARAPAKDWTAEAEALAASRRELNDVVRALHERREPGMSVFEALAKLETRKGTPRLDGGLDAARAFGAQWKVESKAALADLGPTFTRLAPGWKELDAVRVTEWPSTRRTLLETQIGELTEAAETLRKACAGVAPWFPALDEASADSLELADRILADVQTTPRPTAALLAGGEDEVEAWLSKVEEARTLETRLEPYEPSMLAQPLDDWRGTLKQWLGVFLLGWIVLALTVRWAAKRVAKSKVPPSNALFGDVETALSLRKAKTELGASAPRIAALVGAVPMDPWELPKVDAEALHKLCAWSRSFRNRATRFPKATGLAAAGGTDASPAIAAFREAYAKYSAAVRAVTGALELSGSWTKPAEPGHLAASVLRASKIRENASQLREWGAYRRNRDACLALGLTKAVKALEKDEVSADGLVAAFEHGWLAWWLEQRVLAEKALSTFDGLKQRGREERFAEQDRALRDLARDENPRAAGGAAAEAGPGRAPHLAGRHPPAAVQQARGLRLAAAALWRVRGAHPAAQAVRADEPAVGGAIPGPEPAAVRRGGLRRGLAGPDARGHRRHRPRAAGGGGGRLQAAPADVVLPGPGQGRGVRGRRGARRARQHPRGVRRLGPAQPAAHLALPQPAPVAHRLLQRPLLREPPAAAPRSAGSHSAARHLLRPGEGALRPRQYGDQPHRGRGAGGRGRPAAEAPEREQAQPGRGHLLAGPAGARRGPARGRAGEGARDRAVLRPGAPRAAHRQEPGEHPGRRARRGPLLHRLRPGLAGADHREHGAAGAARRRAAPERGGHPRPRAARGLRLLRARPARICRARPRAACTT
ncbi:MAG: DUF4011 domain-containing protein [Myxococcales bacterium]